MKRCYLTSCCILALLVLLPLWSGCSQPQPAATNDQVQAADLRDVDRLVAVINDRPHKPWSQRAYDRRDRAMALLAEKTAALLASAEGGAGEQALTGSWNEGSAARRTALADLNDAARSRGLRAIAESHRRLRSTGG